MAKEIISATIDSDLVDALAHETARTERSRSWIISKAIRHYLRTAAPQDDAAKRLLESEKLYNEISQLNPRKNFRPFVKSFDSFEEYEVWKRGKKRK